MIKPVLTEYFLREAPPALKELVAEGEARIYGSVIRSVKSGQILGYLQEAAPMAKMIDPATVVKLSALTNPVTAAPVIATEGIKVAAELGGLVQNEVLRRGMNDVKLTTHLIDGKVDLLSDTAGRIAKSVDLVQAMGVANLAMGAAGIGLAVAGFKVMSAKIDDVRSAIEGVSQQIANLGTRIEQIRQDAIEGEFSELRSLAKLMDEGWHIGDAGTASRQWHEVAMRSQVLQDRFEDRSRHLLLGPEGYEVADPMLDAVALASGLRVASLAACDETNAADRAAEEGMKVMHRLTGAIGAADLVRHRLEAQGVAPGSAEWTTGQAKASEELRPIVRKIRNREAAMATRTAPLAAIEARGLRPHDWLRAAHEETEAPVLLMLEEDRT